MWQLRMSELKRYFKSGSGRAFWMKAIRAITLQAGSRRSAVAEGGGGQVFTGDGCQP